jgi:hypothetical protein
MAIWFLVGCRGGVAVTESEARCATCSKRVKVRIYSAGLSDVIAFTCTRDSTVLTISTQDETLSSVLGGYPRTAWSDSQYRMVETQLRPCPCGGTFKHDSLPKCPNCGTILRVEGLGRSEFVVVGRMINGEKQNPWR